ncbi:MAG: ABC transporter ATP-binding protein [Pseudomonadales bacterium]|jgi:oligopeptide/dipeptide ABC transporter ATP-binding protein|nr:ABC transporter ATP-binding protein [Pseudomonadales bacterium]
MTSAAEPPAHDAPRADTVLEVANLEVEFDTYGGTVHAVRDVSFRVPRGKTLAIVGESGCGKSVTVQALMGLIPMPPGRITNGSAKLDGQEILGLPERELNRIRGARMGMIFQDPMTSLNPTMRIGEQIAETLRVHRGLAKAEALAKAVELLEKARIPEPAQRARQYPFEFSGGMLQRAMIAMALACSPQLLIADEPTTALDVTIQAQLLDLMAQLQRDEGMSIILITHDLGVVARMADDVAVMYAGQIVETGTVDDVFYRGGHPYTQGLRRATPSNDPDRPHELRPIDGTPPDLFHPPKGCGYFARCPHAMALCEAHLPPAFALTENPGHLTHRARCWLQHPDAPRVDDVHQVHRETHA